MFRLTRYTKERPLRFDGFEFDLASGRLRRDDEEIKLVPQCRRLLAYLARHRNRPVSRRELIGALWAHRVVEENVALNLAIAHLREALDDQAARARYIETVPRVGYRFIAETETKHRRPGWFRMRR